LLYKDGGCNNAPTTVILSGELQASDVNVMAKVLNEDKYLIVHQVGLPIPSETLAEDFDFPTEDDHVWSYLNEFDGRCLR